jgi:hypothetical protein
VPDLSPRFSVVEECEVTKLVAVVDPKTKEKKKAKFAKNGAMCIARVAVEKSICIEAFDAVPQVGLGGEHRVHLWGVVERWTFPPGRFFGALNMPRAWVVHCAIRLITVLTWECRCHGTTKCLDIAPLQLGRFTLRDEGKTIAIGKVLRIPKRGGAVAADS